MCRFRIFNILNCSSLPHRLARDASFQSDSSHCSSVESLLELRRADPTAILLDLGFGGCTACPQENGPLSRIPKRFLQPSSLKGIAIDDFVKQQQQTSESFDSVSLGYRGLTGKTSVTAYIITFGVHTREKLWGQESLIVVNSTECTFDYNVITMNWQQQFHGIYSVIKYKVNYLLNQCSIFMVSIDSKLMDNEVIKSWLIFLNTK